MARVSNFSEDASVEVFGTLKSSGQDVRFVLEPGQQTVVDVEAKGVRGGEGVTIFDEDIWWRVLTKEVFIYDYEDGAFDDWFSADLSLHCIPFRPASGGTSFDPGYMPDQDFTTAVALDRDSPHTQIPEYTPHRHKEREINSHHRLFGKFVRTKQFISVRLSAIPLLLETPGDLPTRLAEWKEKIEEQWNQSDVLPPDPEGSPKLIFECDWTNGRGHSESHYSVVVHGFKKRASMFTFPIGMSGHVAVHEFGHYLGLGDGYIFSGELPAISRHLQTGKISIQDPEVRKLLSEKDSSFDAIIGSLFFGDRANTRVANITDSSIPSDCCSGPENVMERSASLRFNKCLINYVNKTIDRDGDEDGVHDTQPLCWKERLLCRHFPSETGERAACWKRFGSTD